MTQELAVREVPLTPMRVDEVVGQVQLIQEIMQAVMKNGEHYGTIPGCGDKPSLLKPGAEKIMLTFRMVPDPEVTVHDLPHPTVTGHREYRSKVKLYARDGSYLGGGVGTCSTLETKYRYRTGPVEFTDQPVPREYWDLRKSNPAKAQELLGQGKVAKKNDAGLWMIAAQGGKIEHDNPADYYNTCEKMSKKRALVDATLTVTAASDIFTQDVEDFPDEIKPQAKPEPAKEKPQAAPAAPSKVIFLDWLEVMRDDADKAMVLKQVAKKMGLQTFNNLGEAAQTDVIRNCQKQMDESNIPYEAAL